MKLQEIPQTWTICGLALSLVLLRAFGVDSWTTASLSLIIGYLTGKHIEQSKEPLLIPVVSPLTSEKIV